MTRPALVVTAQGARGLGLRLPCAIGRGGITLEKREGDGATPAGRLMVTGCLYRADRMARPAPWAAPVGPRDLWCDDPAHPAYNHFARAPFVASHERLSRPDPLYDIVLTTDWNWPAAIPGRGSAIFLHRWRAPRYPTAGCIAFAPAVLALLSRVLFPGAVVEVRP